MNAFIAKNTNRRTAFTILELLVILAVLAVLGCMLLPAFARTRSGSTSTQCRNNLKQLAVAWSMYSAEHNGRLVSSYPNFNGFTGSWCTGTAQSSGDVSLYYGYGGADPAGITNGLLWPYIRALSVYKCSLDDRIATGGLARYRGKPILRSISMNSFMAGTSFGVEPTYAPTMSQNQRNPNIPVLLEENEISHPSRVWVILEEDPLSINDGMFLVDMGGSRKFVDLPSRLHHNTYGINFADGHVEHISLRDAASLNWVPGVTGGATDWLRLSSITTNPLQ